MNNPNLRRYPRRTARITARVDFGWGTLEGTIENIGEGGVLFVTDTLEGSVEVGDHAEVRFHPLPDAEESNVPGEVLRVERDFLAGEILRTLAIRFDHPFAPA